MQFWILPLTGFLVFYHLPLLLPGHKMVCVGQAYRYISKRTLPLVTRIANRSLMNSSKVSKFGTASFQIKQHTLDVLRALLSTMKLSTTSSTMITALALLAATAPAVHSTDTAGAGPPPL